MPKNIERVCAAEAALCEWIKYLAREHPDEDNDLNNVIQEHLDKLVDKENELFFSWQEYFAIKR